MNHVVTEYSDLRIFLSVCFQLCETRVHVLWSEMLASAHLAEPANGNVSCLAKQANANCLTGHLICRAENSINQFSTGFSGVSGVLGLWRAAVGGSSAHYS